MQLRVPPQPGITCPCLKCRVPHRQCGEGEEAGGAGEGGGGGGGRGEGGGGGGRGEGGGDGGDDESRGEGGSLSTQQCWYIWLRPSLLVAAGQAQLSSPWLQLRVPPQPGITCPCLKCRVPHRQCGEGEEAGGCSSAGGAGGGGLASTMSTWAFCPRVLQCKPLPGTGSDRMQAKYKVPGLVTTAWYRLNPSIVPPPWYGPASCTALVKSQSDQAERSGINHKVLTATTMLNVSLVPTITV